MYAVKRRSVAFDLTKGCDLVTLFSSQPSYMQCAVQYCLHLHSLHSPSTFTKVLHQKFSTHDKAVNSTTALTAYAGTTDKFDILLLNTVTHVLLDNFSHNSTFPYPCHTEKPQCLAKTD